MDQDDGVIGRSVFEPVARVALRKVLVEAELNRVGARPVVVVFKAFDELCFCDIVVSARRPVSVGVERLDMGDRVLAVHAVLVADGFKGPGVPCVPRVGAGLEVVAGCGFSARLVAFAHLRWFVGCLVGDGRALEAPVGLDLVAVAHPVIGLPPQEHHIRAHRHRRHQDYQHRQGSRAQPAAGPLIHRSPLVRVDPPRPQLRVPRQRLTPQPLHVLAHHRRHTTTIISGAVVGHIVNGGAVGGTVNRQVIDRIISWQAVGATVADQIGDRLAVGVVGGQTISRKTASGRTTAPRPV